MKKEIIDEYIDIIEHKAGKYNKYQIFILILGHCIFINTFLTLDSAPLFMEIPKGDVLNLTTKEIEHDVKITKDVCMNKNLEIKDLTYKPDFSMAIEFDYYCDKWLSAGFNALLFGGLFVALISLDYFSHLLGRKKCIIFSSIANIIISIFTGLAFNTATVFIGVFLFSWLNMFAAHSIMLMNQEQVINSKRGLFATIVQLGYISEMIFFDIVIYYANSGLFLYR